MTDDKRISTVSSSIVEDLRLVVPALRDRIEELEDKLTKAVVALEKLSTAQCFGNGDALGYDLSESPMGREILARMEYARNTLEELKEGEKQ